MDILPIVLDFKIMLKLLLAFFTWQIVFIIVFFTINDDFSHGQNIRGSSIWLSLVLSSAICAGLYFLV